MMTQPLVKAGWRHMVFATLALIVALAITPSSAAAQVTAFKQAVATAAAKDKDIAAFYQANGYKSVWTGNSGRDSSRRRALFVALAKAGDHGLPVRRYDPTGLKAKMKAARNPAERGKLEVEISRVFVQYSRDLQTGALNPRKIDSGIVRAIPYRARTSYLVNFVKSSPNGFFKALPPKTPEYTRLMKEKIKLERMLAKGGYGPKVPGKSLKPGQSGAAVVAMRNRLIVMSFLKRNSSQTYDGNLQKAVQQFQLARGLSADGVAGASTVTQLNVSLEKRLQSVVVALERERWLNQPRGKRHVLVNITDYSAKIYDNDKLTFETRSVVGANTSDRRTPEFSDIIEFMVINPTWNVPRSIATKEYLPMMKRNPNAAGHLQLYDSRGRKVSRANINFSAYNASNFPYAIKQPPSRRNALGLVKFMFPNKHNIYLHDTPAKKLFGREMRAHSHGCVRLADPFDFAYALLAKQTNDPEGTFKGHLNTKRESVVQLKENVPVHIIYRTAFTTAKGHMQYRRDIYGRDAKIWNALAKAGVALRAVRG